LRDAPRPQTIDFRHQQCSEEMLFGGGGIHTLLNLVRPKFEAEGRLVEKGLAAHQPAIWEALQTPLAGLGRFLDRECILDASSTENAASAANVD